MTRPSGLSGAGAIGLGKVVIAEAAEGTIGLDEAVAAESTAAASGGSAAALPTAPVAGTPCFGGIGIPFAVGISFP